MEAKAKDTPTKFSYIANLVSDAIAESYKAGVRAGIREVVEWGNEYCVWHPKRLPNGSLQASVHRRECFICWQAFKKDRGLE